jgi:hypothetical protein
MSEPRGVEDETRYAEQEMEPEGRSPEEAALRIVHEPGASRVQDPELALMAEDPDEGPECHFDDEEYEGRSPRDRGDDDHEPDLEELLERQHYAFPEEHGMGERD